MELTKREHKILDVFLFTVMSLILIIICTVFILNYNESVQTKKAQKEVKHLNK
jgi:hypothetical protein